MGPRRAVSTVPLTPFGVPRTAGAGESLAEAVAELAAGLGCLLPTAPPRGSTPVLRAGNAGVLLRRDAADQAVTRDNRTRGSPLDRSRRARTARCCGRGSRQHQDLVVTPVKWRLLTGLMPDRGFTSPLQRASM